MAFAASTQDRILSKLCALHTLDGQGKTIRAARATDYYTKTEGPETLPQVRHMRRRAAVLRCRHLTMGTGRRDKEEIRFSDFVPLYEKGGMIRGGAADVDEGKPYFATIATSCVIRVI